MAALYKEVIRTTKMFTDLCFGFLLGRSTWPTTVITKYINQSFST